MGAGNWSRKAHLPSYRKIGEAQVVAICDSNKGLAEDAASEFRIPKVYTDYRDLLEKEDLDAIDICSSAKSHYEVASAAIQRRKSVLCEKPLAMNLKEARSLWDCANRAKVKTKMGFTFRYSPALRRMKELIDEDFTGEPYLVNGFEQNSQFIKPTTPFRWNPNENSSDIFPGSLEEYAPHLIDIALWFLGDMAKVVGNMKNFVSQRLIRGSGKGNANQHRGRVNMARRVQERGYGDFAIESRGGWKLSRSRDSCFWLQRRYYRAIGGGGRSQRELENCDSRPVRI